MSFQSRYVRPARLVHRIPFEKFNNQIIDVVISFHPDYVARVKHLESDIRYIPGHNAVRVSPATTAPDRKTAELLFLWMDNHFETPVPVPGSQAKTFNRFL